MKHVAALDNPRARSEQAPTAHARGMQRRRTRIRRRARQLVEDQTFPRGALHHPFERERRYAWVGTTAADIGVATGEPDLLHTLGILLIALRPRWPERGALLVERQGMTEPLHFRGDGVVEQTEALPEQVLRHKADRCC